MDFLNDSSAISDHGDDVVDLVRDDGAVDSCLFPKNYQELVKTHITKTILPGEYKVLINETGECVFVENAPPTEVEIPEKQRTAFQLLELWGLSEMVDIFKAKNIDIDCFKYITTDDINLMIPENNLGGRIKLRSKLLEWRNENNYPAIPISETVSMKISANITEEWVRSHSNDVPASPVSSFSRNSSPMMFFKHTNVIDMNLNEILIASTQAKQIIAEFNTIQKPLSDRKRKHIIACIADYFIYNNIQMGAKECEIITNKILVIFPLEIPQSYFIKSSGKGTRVRGALYAAYNNKLKYQKKMKKYSCDQVSQPSSSVSSLSTPLSPLVPNITSDESTQTKNWLKFNAQPWLVVEKKWEETFSVRRQDILTLAPNEIFSEWPLFTQSKGLRLIDLDFIELFGEERSLNLHIKWTNFVLKFSAIISEDTKIQKPVDELIKKLQISETNINERALIGFQLLHYKLPPTQRLKLTDNNSKRFWHVSIQDSLDSCLLEVENQADIKVQYDKLKEKYKKTGCPIQPIIAIANNNYYIVSDNIYHKTDTFLSALDYAFKLIFVLNIKYPEQSRNVWDFVQKYFYEIDLDNYRYSSQTFSLLNQLSV